MKHKLSTVIVASLLGATGFSVSAQQAPADAKAAVATTPGKVNVAQSRKVVATVEAIDVAKRQVTLKGPGGRVIPLTVGPDVRNLEQVKVGDQVAVGYVEALSLTLKKDGKELPGATAMADGARSASGARPGGVVAEQVRVIANVTAIDAATKMVTLKGAKQEVGLYVGDPEQLKLIKVGDQIEAVYTQAVAVSVEPVAAKK